MVLQVEDLRKSSPGPALVLPLAIVELGSQEEFKTALNSVTLLIARGQQSEKSPSRL